MSALAEYQEFLHQKSSYGSKEGFAPSCMPSFLFDFQAALVDWSVRMGRDAVFADCGLGKTPIQLVWAQNVVEHTNKNVLVLTPLAVAQQTVKEGDKFGIDAKRFPDGKLANGAHIVVTNYERLHYFSPHDFSGVVCDESSILKSFDGVRRNEISEFMRQVPYRLLCTATAAPNDYVELGTSSEALGYLGHVDMLNRFFKNDRNNSAQGRAYGKQMEWRFKGHAEQEFWKWVCSWARAIRKPSDLGFDDGAFILPPLVERHHFVDARKLADGMLFNLPARDMREEREERRRTITERCECAAQLATHKEPVLIWCHLNDEGDLLEGLIPDAIQVSGNDSDDAKEEKFGAFIDGTARTLICKPKIGAWGLNFQHCPNIVAFPSHSYEQYYQGIRRCWRFGQKRKVHVDIVATEGERGVMDNMARKQQQANTMFSHLVAKMNEQLHLDNTIIFSAKEKVPAWL